MFLEKIQRIKKYCQRNWLFLGLGLGFFAAYLWGMSFYVDNQQFNSPDESANYYFLQSLTSSGQIPVAQPSGLTDVVHPRSILVWQNNLVPISFPGLIYLLAPFYFLFSLWGVFAFYVILFVFLMYLWWRWLRRENLPTYLWFLVAAQPALWYYLFHPLFNNVLSFLLGFSALFLLSENRQWSKNVGVFLMILALWVRPFDLIYFGPLLLVFSIYYQVSWLKRLKYFLAIGVGSLLLFGASNYLVYGSPWLFGYNLPKPPSVVETSLDYWRYFKLFLKNTWYFIVQLFWPYVVFVAAGFTAYLINRKKLPRIYHFLVAGLFLAGGALILFYGFADLNDHVVKNNISIGGAFARYWLPVYVLMLFLIAYLCELIRRAGYRYFAGAVVLALAMFSGYAVICRDNDSLMLERQNLLAGIQESALIQKMVPENSILVIDREDKYLFPVSTVVHLSEFQDDYALRGIRDLMLAGETVYYYGFTLGEVDWNYLHEQKLQPLSMRLQVLTPGLEKSLYQFELYE